MLNFIKLLRPLNLIIIALTMYSVRYGIISSVLGTEENAFSFHFSNFYFALSVIVMILLAASGNIINDYFDVRVDRINKPKKLIVGKYVKRRVAMISHHGFNFLALLITIYLAYETWTWLYIGIPIAIAASLWFYSLSFKKQAFIGNLVVALLIAFVPIWAGLFELHEQESLLSRIIEKTWENISIFSLFAFLLTLIREGIKDIEDLPGDTKVGYKTLPIKWGVKKMKVYLNLLIIAVIILTLIIGFKIDILKPYLIWHWVMVTTIILCLILASISTSYSSSKSGYSKSSFALKIAMLIGITYAFLLPTIASSFDI